ncbi:hypothetical protein M432DRAFT_27653 [Thermoascus aurantiacus ATCC 26904]
MHAYCWRCPHSRLWIFVVSPILGLLLLHHLLKPHIRARSPRLDGETQTMLGHNDSGPSSCHQLHGMDDVLVIMKTGVTEALEKVPVHLQTTLRCVPHYAIFSDFEEQISGVRTHDVLRNVSHEIKQTNPDFGIYNRVRVYGRKGLQESDLVKDVNGPSGKLKNPGWKLDKWKFLPMIDEALQIRPDAKWYYFMEADTYPFWPNLMAWLEQFDPEKPLYIGSQMQIGDVVFAYGGSGIILSNPAMRKASERRAARLAEIDEYTAGHWAGDCVLGKVLHDAGVNLLWAWPMMQTSTIWRVDLINEAYDKKPWCYPAVSFHHMTPADVELVWQFDQRWFREKQRSLLLHSDAFRELIQEHIQAPRDDWDNFSEDSGEEQPSISLADCEARCANNTECMQYSYQPGKCLTSKIVKRGISSSGVHSAWMTDRINATLSKLGSCSTAKWVLK